jgi:hypothetical protein
MGIPILFAITGDSGMRAVRSVVTVMRKFHTHTKQAIL